MTKSTTNLILLNKPFQVLSQFQDDKERETLKKFLPDHPGFYPAGRLDYDSEGLLILTNNGALQHFIANPDKKQGKTYWAQVEGIPSAESLQQFEKGLTLNDGPTKPAKCRAIEEPSGIWLRNPPIRHRQNKPTQWLEITLREGRNRQVRRMTAAIGHPTLRLIRCKIGEWDIGSLQPGEHKELTVNLPNQSQTRKPARRNTNSNKRHTKSRPKHPRQ